VRLLNKSCRPEVAGRRGGSFGRWVGSSGAAAIAGALLVLAVSPAAVSGAPVDAGSVSGRVVDAAGGPLEGICVGVSNGPGATTGPDGAYVVDGIEPGDHTMQFVDCTATPIYVASWYRSRSQQDQADPVTVVANTDVALADMTLAQGVAVSGVVTDGAGTAVAGINVNANPFNPPGLSAGAQTAADGTYRTSPLPDGSYRVQFSDPHSVWATQYWQSAVTFNAATPVQLSLADGNEHGGVNAALEAAATITGLVTDQGGAPLADICVNANTPEQNGLSGLGSSVRSAADGTYSLTGLPGEIDVRVQFHDCSAVPTHIDQWYDIVTDANASTSLILAPGEVRTGIDARLPDGIRVGGAVTDSAGNPLANIDVNVNPDGQGASGFGRTDSAGHYVASPVPPGRYRVQFRDDSSPPSWAAMYWQQQPSYNSATLLELVAGDGPERDGIDAQLGAAASISGTVTGPQGQPVGNICVDAVIATANGPDGLGHALTGPDGSYAFTGLPAAQVRVRVQDCNVVGPYRTVWWPAEDTYEAAGLVDLQAGEHRTGVNVQLTAAATISGTVTDDQQRPLAGICVQAATTQAFGALAQTDGNGNHQMILNAAGDFTVQFVDCTQQPSHAGLTAPDAVPVALGQSVSGVDATLVTGATSTLTGSVRNGDGVAVTGACAVVYLADQYALFGPVNADGTFTVTGIPSGTYALAFLGCDTGQPSPTVHDPVDPARTYQAQWWHSVDLSLAGTTEGGPDPIAQHAALIAIGAGQQLTGYDQCFGCQQAPPEPTQTTTTVPPSAPTLPTAPTRQPSQPTITITGHNRAHSTITLSFVAAPAAVGGTRGLRLADEAADAATITYTATCTATTAPPASLAGTTSPLTLTGVDDSATYSCVIAAAREGIPLGASTAVIVDPIPAGQLPASGTDTLPTAWAAAAVALTGIILVVAGRKPRPTPPDGP
jgi:hypothetical protein